MLAPVKEVTKLEISFFTSSLYITLGNLPLFLSLSNYERNNSEPHDGILIRIKGVNTGTLQRIVPDPQQIIDKCSLLVLFHFAE